MTSVTTTYVQSAHKPRISCDSWLNSIYIYVGLPMMGLAVMLIILAITMDYSQETQLGVVLTCSIINMFVIPFLIKKRIDKIKHQCFMSDIDDQDKIIVISKPSTETASLEVKSEDRTKPKSF